MPTSRRLRPSASPGSSRSGADRFDAYADGNAVSLSRREYELLYQLAATEGRVLEREEIYQRVWGYTMARGDRSVDVFEPAGAAPEHAAAVAAYPMV